MILETTKTFTASFEDISPEQIRQAGGKGRVLADLYRQALPVPNGFVIFPTAFEDDKLRAAAWVEVQQHLAQLRSKSEGGRFAVRSSAVNEDAQETSFAGEFESVLDLQSDEEIQQAIRTVRQSRHHDRVRSYSQAHNLALDQEMAILIQELIPAEFAGVLFTADPVSGNRTVMVGNFIRGLGDRLVSGEVNPDTFTLSRPDERYEGPDSLRPFAGKLFQLAERLEQALGGPQDIEWAVAEGRVYILQSRPITTLPNPQEPADVWNDSLRGDYIWSSTNLGEALPDVMTPFTWSIMQVYFENNRLGLESDQAPMGGNIGGRLYMNLSLFMSVTQALGISSEKARRMSSEVFGYIPDDVTIPTIPLSRWAVLRKFIPHGFRRFRLVNSLKKRIPTFVSEAPAQVDDLTDKIDRTQTAADLLDLWPRELKATLDETCLMLAAGTSDYKNLSRQLHIALEKLVGDSDTNALLSGISTDSDYLASLGPVLGLAQVAQGQLSREDYMLRYGHRGPSELELSQPRPIEDPDWLDRRLAEAERNPIDTPALLAKQRQAHEAAWSRFEANYPRKADKIGPQLDRMATAARTREAVRSEVVRLFGIFRRFALRAGELADLADDIFFLSLNEILAVLGGDRAAIEAIPARRETHTRYAALPPYPPLISGRFDPFQWAANPNRSTSYFDAHRASTPLIADAITGFAGAAGIVEGTVRRLTSPEEGDQLQPGEILVTVTTNVGWTPLFPRAGAIVTDVGAPLSHAAIVARELGIPAVVGCGNATMRLKTGDRVRVDGGQGSVEILSA